MPKFWIFLCRDWLRISHEVSWSWWRALGKSPWTRCRQLHQQVLHYDRSAFPAQNASREEVSAWTEPGTLMQITAELVTQGLLLRRDSAVIDQAVLDRLTANGEWKEQRSKT